MKITSKSARKAIMSSKFWGATGGIVAAVIVGILLWGGLTQGWFGPPGAALVTPTGVFDIEISDGRTLDSLELDDFDYTLYGTDDLDDWISFEEIEDGTSLSSISVGDLSDFAFYVIRYNGTVTVPDPNNKDNDIDVIYYERWAQIFNNTLNSLVAYREPSDEGIIILNMDTFGAVNITAGIEAPTNITILVASNGSEPIAAWVTGKNYENGVDDKPYFVIGFNDTVALSDFTVSNTVKSRYNSTALQYDFNTIDAFVSAFNGAWDPDANLNITSVDLYFGDVLLDSAV